MKMLPKFLTSSSYPLEKNFFLVPRFCFKLIGLNPEAQITWPIGLWGSFSFLALWLCSCSSLYYGICQFQIDVATGLDAVCPHTTSLMCFVKISYIWYYRSELKSLIKRLRNLLESQNSVEKMKVKRRYYNLATRLILTMLLLGCLTFICYMAEAYLQVVLQYMRGESITYKTPFYTQFPDLLLRMPLLPLTIIFSHWYGTVTLSTFVACDGFFCSFCFYVTSLLKLIAIDLKDTLKEYSSFEHRDKDENEVFCQLKSIIERYNEIADINARFSKVMGFVVLAHFFSSSIVIGIGVVNLLLFPGYGSILFVCFTGAVTSESFLYCIGGTEIMDSSSELATVAYCSAWYTHSLRIQKMVLTLLTRTQQSLIIKVPFFAPSLPVLTSILKTTGSLIALGNSLIK